MDEIRAELAAKHATVPGEADLERLAINRLLEATSTTTSSTSNGSGNTAGTTSTGNTSERVPATPVLAPTLEDLRKRLAYLYGTTQKLDEATASATAASRTKDAMAAIRAEYAAKQTAVPGDGDLERLAINRLLSAATTTAVDVQNGSNRQPVGPSPQAALDELRARLVAALQATERLDTAAAKVAAASRVQQMVATVKSEPNAPTDNVAIESVAIARLLSKAAETKVAPPAVVIPPELAKLADQVRAAAVTAGAKPTDAEVLARAKAMAEVAKQATVTAPDAASVEKLAAAARQAAVPENAVTCPTDQVPCATTGKCFLPANAAKDCPCQDGTQACGLKCVPARYNCNMTLKTPVASDVKASDAAGTTSTAATARTCSGDKKFVCPSTVDSATPVCVAQLGDCGCPGKDKLAAKLQLSLPAAARMETGRPFSVTAYGLWNPCNADASNQLKYGITVKAAQGTTATPPTPVVKGKTFVFEQTAAGVYEIEVNVSTPDNVQTSAKSVVTVVAPKPLLQIIGADSVKVSTATKELKFRMQVARAGDAVPTISCCKATDASNCDACPAALAFLVAKRVQHATTTTAVVAAQSGAAAGTAASAAGTAASAARHFAQMDEAAVTAATKPSTDAAALVEAPVSDIASIPVGKYTLTASIGDVSAVLKVEVVAAPVIDIKISGPALVDAASASNFYAAVPEKTTCAFTVTDLDGKTVASGDKCLLAIPANTLSASQTYTVAIKATNGDRQGSGTYTVKAAARPKGSCVVQLASDSDAVAIAASSSLTVAGEFNGIPEDATPKYRFGYNNGRSRVYLSHSAQEKSIFQCVAPVMAGNPESVSAKFFVEVAFGKVEVAAVAECTIDIKQALAKRADLAREQTDIAAASASKGETSATVNTLANALAASSTDVKAKAVVTRAALDSLDKTTAAVASSSSTTPVEATLTKANRDSVVGLIKDMDLGAIRKQDPPAAGAPATVASADDCDETCRVAARKKMLSLVTKVVTLRDEATNEKPVVDANTATAMVTVLTDMPPSPEVSEALKSVATAFAGSLPADSSVSSIDLGSSVVTAGSFDAAQLADQIAPVVVAAKDGTKIEFAANVDIPESKTSAAVSVSVAQEKVMTLPAAGLPAKVTKMSPQTEFSFIADKTVVSLTNLVNPIKLKLRIGSKAECPATEALDVKFHDGSAWSSQGITQVARIEQGDDVFAECLVNHLSTYIATSSSSSSTEASAQPLAGDAAKSAGSNPPPASPPAGAANPPASPAGATPAGATPAGATPAGATPAVAVPAAGGVSTTAPVVGPPATTVAAAGAVTTSAVATLPTTTTDAPANGQGAAAAAAGASATMGTGTIIAIAVGSVLFVAAIVGVIIAGRKRQAASRIAPDNSFIEAQNRLLVPQSDDQLKERFGHRPPTQPTMLQML